MSFLPVSLSRGLRRLGRRKRTSADQSQASLCLPDKSYTGIRVLGINRDIRVKIASTESECDQAFQLVTQNYRQRGYESSVPGQLRFTPHHALPDTVILVAKDQEQVVYTMTLVFDNLLLGLPMETLYGAEIASLREQGRRIVEVTCLADNGLSLREFSPVFTAVVRTAIQYAISQMGDTWVISVNPKHRKFYRKVMGFVPFGPVRNYPSVRNHPAEPLRLDEQLLKTNAPAMYEEVFAELLAPEELTAKPMSPELVRRYSNYSSQMTKEEAGELLQWVERLGNPRRW